MVERFVRNEEARGSNPLTSRSAHRAAAPRHQCTRTNHQAYLNSQPGPQRTLSRLASRLVPFSAFSLTSACRSGALIQRRGAGRLPAKPWRRLLQPRRRTRRTQNDRPLAGPRLAVISQRRDESRNRMLPRLRRLVIPSEQSWLSTRHHFGRRPLENKND